MPKDLGPDTTNILIALPLNQQPFFIKMEPFKLLISQ